MNNPAPGELIDQVPRMSFVLFTIRTSLTAMVLERPFFTADVGTPQLGQTL